MTETLFLAGHRGMVGSAIARALEQHYPAIEVLTRTRAELDLCDQAAVRVAISEMAPDSVILAAAKVGGIAANAAYPADFLSDNLTLQNNVIDGAFRCGVKRLLFLGSSCIYPKNAPQPLREEALLTGPLEPTNEPYALAKIAGIKMCEAYNRQFGTDFRSVMPTNLYGPGDNFHPENSHVLPAMIRRLHEAKNVGAPSVTIWGSGTPRREFLHVDDMAAACLHVHMADPDRIRTVVEPTLSHINVGTGHDITILELASLVADIVGFEGRIDTDPSRPDGTPVKRLDVSKMAQLGWRATIDLRDGIEQTYRWYLENRDNLRG